MERILHFNGKRVDVDETTALGITLASYDVSEPAQAKRKASNTFTIPATALNLSFVGFDASAFALSASGLYEKVLCDYWLAGEQLLTQATVRFGEIDPTPGGRLECLVFEKEAFWGAVKNISWDFFEKIIMPSFLTSRGIPYRLFSLYSGSLETFLVQYSRDDPAQIIKLALRNSALTGYKRIGDADGVYLENDTEKRLAYHDPGDARGVNQPFANGSHLSIYLQYIFEALEFTYGWNFGTQETFAGNIFNDNYFKTTYLNWPRLRVYKEFGADKYGFDIASRYPLNPAGIDTYEFRPGAFDNVEPLAGKTMFDFITSTAKMFNLIIEPTHDGARFLRFDELANVTPDTDWSGSFAPGATYKNSIENTAINNYIYFSSVYETGDEKANALNLQCDNEALQDKSDYVKIDGYVPSVSEASTGDVVPNLTEKKAFETFLFLRDGAPVNRDVDYFIEQFDTSAIITPVYESISATVKYGATVNLYTATGLQPDGYTVLGEIVKKPFVVKAKRKLSPRDLNMLGVFKLVYINDFGGTFYVNKIAELNPATEDPTEIELIKINNNLTF